MSYTKKDKFTLSYDASVKRIRGEGKIALDSVMNEALAAFDQEHSDAKNNGEVLEVTDRVTLMRYLRTGTRKQIGS